MVAELVAEAEKAFKTVWLLTAADWYLLFGQGHVRSIAGELTEGNLPSRDHDKAIEAALERQWMSYIAWLPKRCRP